MSAKHTPGPWTQGTSKIGLTCVWLDGITEQRDGRGLGPENTWIDCNTEANARLIAAAPDLLEALKACDEAMSYMSEYDIPLTLPGQVKDAIAKATGEEK